MLPKIQNKESHNFLCKQVARQYDTATDLSLGNFSTGYDVIT